MQVPFMDLKQQYQSIKNEIDTAIQTVVTRQEFIGGEEKNLFEKEFAEINGSKFCVGLGNGTDSLFLTLKCLGVGPGDQVIVPANSFIASSEMVTATGARVLFCDVDDKTFTLDLNQVERLAQKHKNIKAIMPVHLYGQMMDMQAVLTLAKRYGWKVLEDTAQAHLAERNGKKAGTLGDAGSFSFYPGKNLGAYGDAGAIVTSDEDLALKIRKLANHGRTKKYDHDTEGFNSRLDNLQAAILRVKLRHLPRWTELRRQKSATYRRLLEGLPGLQIPQGTGDPSHVFHLFVVRLPHRDQIQARLKADGIEASVHYPICLPFLDAYKYLGHSEADFPVAARHQREILSLPFFPEITENQMQFVAQRLAEHLKNL